MEDLKVEIIEDILVESDLKFKVIVLGNAFVGKTCIISKASKNIFTETYSVTLGFDKLPFNVKIDDKIISLELWDTCGTEKYKSLIKKFYKNSAAAIIVYSIESKESFDDIFKFWLNDVKLECNPDIKIFLIGNKADLDNERKVKLKDAEKVSKENGFSYFCETSAKNGLNIKELFVQVAKILYGEHLRFKERAMKIENNIPVPVKINKNKNEKKGCC